MARSIVDESRSSKRRYRRRDAFRVQPYRRLAQAGFLLLSLWIGVQFTLFLQQVQSGTEPTLNRPPGVEAYLPISSLISLKYWVLGGVFSRVHPAGLILFLVVLATGLLLKKGFCSWVCPVGFASEGLARLQRALFGRAIVLPRWLDYPLRSVKYLLLLFFLWAVLWQMDLRQIERFLHSPYNQVADVKMLHFFTAMSALTLKALLALVLLSLLVRHFWCRFLCPYGALLGALSWLSPLKVHRNAESCIDCLKCTQVCPAALPVHRQGAVRSDECHGCLACVDVCPVRDTLYVSLGRRRGRVHPLAFGAAVVLLFLLGTGIGRGLGLWYTAITPAQYAWHMAHLDDPVYTHNRGRVPEGTWEGPGSLAPVAGAPPAQLPSAAPGGRLSSGEQGSPGTVQDRKTDPS